MMERLHQGFVGDTLFMPDNGTARADFPGGDVALLYPSIRRLLALPISEPPGDCDR
jgi:glyoxylase-like metal-dependent hydrolase (beta-lactamase superfamily II)